MTVTCDLLTSLLLLKALRVATDSDSLRWRSGNPAKS
jgi:hypothetical protein